MITLYYRPKTSGRPMRAAWLLEEIGVDYDTVAVEDTDTPEHRRHQPLGRVPVVRFEDGTELFDSTAILLQLADLHPDAGLLPPVGTYDRGLAYQWTLTAMTELETATIKHLTEDDDDSRQAFREATQAFGDALGDREFLVGDRIGVADIVLVGVLFIAQRMQLTTDEGPENLRDYFVRLGSRPALARAAERTESILQPAVLLPD